jgi:hypothetical protein
MKAGLLFTGAGSLVILTSYDSLTHPGLLAKLAAKGIPKFVGYEIPFALAQARYGTHFQIVLDDLRETDDLRVLDYDGQRAFQLFSWRELGTPIMYEPQSTTTRHAAA